MPYYSSKPIDEANGPISNDRQRACHSTLPWLISVWLDDFVSRKATVNWKIIIITLALALTVSAQSQLSQFRVTLDNGYFSVTNAKTGQWLGGVSLEKWKRIATYTDNRHAALDVTAGVVAGGGSREHTVDPNSPVYTMADYKSGKALLPTGTEERGRYSVIMSDAKVHGRYEAIIVEAKR